MHLHIENNSRAPSLSHIAEAHVRAAVGRHPGMQGLDFTVGWDGDLLEQVLPKVDFMIASRPPREDLGQRAPRLRWLQTTGAGIDHLLPLDWLPAEVTLTNNSGPHGPKCEEYCRMALLLLGMRLPQFVHQQFQRRWEPHYTPLLRGQLCVVIGYGDLGQAAVRAAKGLGLRCVAVSRSGIGDGPADELLPVSRLDDILPQADFVVLTIPLTPETRDLMDRRRLAMLRPEAGLVNVARGPVIDNSALAEFLTAGRLGGAVLDVHDPEPVPHDSELWHVPNLIITPHVAGDVPTYVDDLLDNWASNLERFIAGRPLRNVVDPMRGY